MNPLNYFRILEQWLQILFYKYMLITLCLTFGIMQIFMFALCVQRWLQKSTWHFIAFLNKAYGICILSIFLHVNGTRKHHYAHDLNNSTFPIEILSLRTKWMISKITRTYMKFSQSISEIKIALLYVLHHVFLIQPLLNQVLDVWSNYLNSS